MWQEVLTPPHVSSSCRRTEAFQHFWIGLPPKDWLGDVVEFTRHMCQAQVAREAKIRKSRFHYLAQLHVQEGPVLVEVPPGYTIEGQCLGPGAWTFSLCHSSRKQIARAVQRAWAWTVPFKVGHRKGLANLDPIASALHIRHCCPCRQPCSQLFVTASQGDTCPRLLEQSGTALLSVDDKWHRVYQCPAVQSVRELFAPLLAWMSDHAPHWLHAAVATEHRDQHVLRQVFRHRPWIPPLPLSIVPVAGAKTLYIDGSCTVPSVPQARHAAWSVVADAGLHLSTQALVSAYAQLGTTLSMFHVVSQGLVPKEQTTRRAEICGLLTAISLAQAEPSVTFKVYSDSQYALDFVSRLVAGKNSRKAPSTDVDLCAWSWILVVPPSVSSFKVKSHVCPLTVSMVELRQTLGNTVADEAAKQARLADLPFVYQLLQEVEDWHALQEDMWHAYFWFQFHCAEVLAPLRKGLRHEVEGCDCQPDLGEQRLTQWLQLQPAVTMICPCPGLQTAWLQSAPWPPWFVQLVWRWSQARARR